MLWNHIADRVKQFDLPHIHSVLGPSFTCDAARFGSGAYRLYMFWSNLQAAQHMDLALSRWQRSPGLLVGNLLDPNRVPLAVGLRRQQPPPHYPCNLDPRTIE